MKQIHEIGLLLYVAAFGCAGVTPSPEEQQNETKEQQASEHEDALVPDASPLVKRGERYMSIGELGEASASFRSAIIENAQDARAYFDLGLVLELQGQPQLAIPEYQEAERLLPQFVQAKNNLAVLLREQGNLRRAQELLSDAVKIDPTYGDAWLNLALSFEDSRQLDKAKVAYQRAIKLLPSDPLPLTNLALIELAANDVNAAKTKLQKAYPLARNDAQMLIEIASGLRRAGDAALAVRVLGNVKTLLKELPPAVLAELAIAQHANGASEQSLATLDELEKKDSKYTAVHYFRGSILAAMGSYAKAAQSFRRYLKQEPKGAFTEKSKAHLEEIQRLQKNK
ncbi:MAG: tetratricopeptide repeat protein [Myxococcales bacterium]|nr:MAG: tetratricopeptide repeat protein [Myxococcales bacterium]